MRQWRGLAALASGLMLVAGLATGCANPKDSQITALQERIDELMRQNADLDGRLRSAMNDANNARARALELQQLLDDARRAAAAQPASNLPEGWVGADGIAWTDIADDILFDSGKADLKASGRSALDRIVAQINSNFPDWNIWVVGHTDTDPIKRTANLWKDNLDLSVNRGATVVRELYNRGIAKDRLVAAGQGEWAPKAENSSRAGKSQNRRVQIIAVRRPPNISAPTQGAAST